MIIDSAYVKGNLGAASSNSVEFAFLFLAADKYDLALPMIKLAISKNVEVTVQPKTTFAKIIRKISVVEQTVAVFGESPVNNLKTYQIKMRDFRKEAYKKILIEGGDSMGREPE